MNTVTSPNAKPTFPLYSHVNEFNVKLLTKVSYDDLGDGAERHLDHVDTLAVFVGGGAGRALRKAASPNRAENFRGDVGPLTEQGRRG